MDEPPTSTSQDHICILYGTQTGTAEEVAQRIGREAKRRHFRARVIGLEFYDIAKLLEERLVIFVVATTGQGEFPDSMKKFWKALMSKRLTSMGDPLKHMKFAVFGLGDSSYRLFNFVGKKVYRRMINLGASAIIRRGDGDDQAKFGYEEELNAWLDELWSKLPMPPGMAIKPSTELPPPRYRVSLTATNTSQRNVSAQATLNDNPNFLAKYRYAKVASNTRLSAVDWEQDIRHIVLDITNTGLLYEPGDVVDILPRNMREDAAAFLDYMGIDPNTMVYDFIPNDEDIPPTDLPVPCTVLELFEGYFDFMSSPKRYFFELLSFFAKEEREIERLSYFASMEGQDDLKWYNKDVHRTVFQVFKDFPSARPPLEYLFELIPRIQCRSFSISSSIRAHPNQIHVTVGVVKFVTKLGKIKKGICSSWLASLSTGAGVPVKVRPGYIRLPEASKPVIMVGPGTGCAMFKAMLEERNTLGHSGQNTFFFGNRHQAKDFIYSEMWKTFVQNGTLFLFSAAFSRDQEKKVYVQHKIKEHSKDIWQLLQSGAYIFVSGSKNQMPKDVREAFVDVIQKEGALTPDQAEEYVQQLEKSNRYLTETWS